MATYLVRIRPDSPREMHIAEGRTFRKAGGWYQCPSKELADALREIPENDLNPMSGPMVFEVKEREEAKIIDEREKKRADPAGTPEQPRQPAEVPGAATSPRTVRRSGGKKDDPSEL